MQEQPQSPQVEALLANAAWVQRLARKLVSDAHQADDLAQDVLAIALDRPPIFARNREHLRKWLGGVTRHLASKHRRREGERGSRESIAADHGRDPERNPAERLELHAKLVRGVLSLGEPYQATVILRFFDGLSTREISSQQGVPEGTVRQRLNRAMSKLREQLDADFDGHREHWCLALATLYPTPASLSPLIAKAMVAALFAALLGIFGFRALQGESSAGTTDLATLIALTPSTEKTSETEPSRVAKQVVQPERQAVPHAMETAATFLTVQVLPPQNLTLGETTVHVVSGDELVESMVCDPTGTVRLQPNDGPGFLVAQTADRPAVFLELGKLEGLHEMQIQRGASLSGVLIEDGQILDTAITLSLYYKPIPYGKLSKTVRTELNSAGVLIGAVELQSNHLGRFEFKGLKPDYWGSLRLPNTHWFISAPEGGSLADGVPEIAGLPGPAQNVRLQISRLPTIKGRVVDAQTGIAIPNPSMMLHATFTDQDNSPSTILRGEADGTFEIGFSPGSSSRSPLWLDASKRPGIEKVTIQIGNTGHYLGASFSLNKDQIGPDGQIGDLAVSRGINLPLRILDSSGNPIIGARASVSGSGSNTEPSDEFGMLILGGVSPKSQKIYVGAPDKRLRLIKLQQPASKIQDSVDVVLQQGSRLDINLQTTPATATRFLSLSLEGTEPRLFEFGNPGMGFRLNRATDSAAINSSSWGEQGGYGTFEHAADGAFSIRNLIPGMAIDLVVKDRSRNVLLRKAIKTPAWGETSTLALTIPQLCFDLAISAHDSSGSPVPEVVFTVQKQDSDDSTSATTTSDGRTTLLGLFSPKDPVTITAKHPDFVPIEIGPLMLTSNTKLPPFLMQRGRSLKVSITDSNGVPMPINQLIVEAPGHPPTYARAQGLDPLFLQHMPEVPLNLRFEYDEQEFAWTCNASTRETAYTIETYGTVEFRPEAGTPASRDSRLIFWVTALDGSPTPPGSEPQRAWKKWFNSDETGKVLREPLLPGRYKAQLFHGRRTGLAEAPCGPEHSFEVHANTHSKLTLRFTR